jgi:hypothetical protein
VTFDEEGCHKYWPTFVSELSGYDMDMQWQACTALLHIFPTLASCHNALFTYESVVISAQGLEMFGQHLG